LLSCFFRLEAAQVPFETFLKSLAQAAQAQGVSKSTIKQVFPHIQFDQKAIEKDRSQHAYKELTYQEYWKIWLTDSGRLEQGRELLKTHSAILKEVEQKYGVPKEVIVALWGTETLYGRIMGTHDIVDALASLAYEGRRREFFTNQLISALKIIQGGHVKKEDMLGSWAGAMGHCQFMPSNFFAYAVDFDGDKKRNLWSSLPDVFASIANYLRKNKWEAGKLIGSFQMSPKKGVDIGLKGAPQLVPFANYKVILRWNRSPLFAAKILFLSEEFKK